MRINKYLSSCNVNSRRKCEELITNGLVKINGMIVTDLSFQVDEKKDKVEVNGKEIRLEEEKVYYLLNKPVGVISAAFSKYGEKTVVDLIEDEDKRIFPVGRLDKETSGLIFLTNDGDFSYILTHPKYEKNKTYLALLEGRVDDRDLIKLSKGVVIDDKITARAKVVLVKHVKGNSLISISIREGRNRQIRKMCQLIHHNVIELKRTNEAGISLGDLAEGQYRKLTNAEVKKLKTIEKTNSSAEELEDKKSKTYKTTTSKTKIINTSNQKNRPYRENKDKKENKDRIENKERKENKENKTYLSNKPNKNYKINKVAKSTKKDD